MKGNFTRWEMLSPEKIHWIAEADRAFFYFIFFNINIHDGELYTVACMWLKDLMDFCISNVCLLPCLYDFFSSLYAYLHVLPYAFLCVRQCVYVCGGQKESIRDHDLIFKPPT